MGVQIARASAVEVLGRRFFSVWGRGKTFPKTILNEIVHADAAGLFWEGRMPPFSTMVAFGYF